MLAMVGDISIKYCKAKHQIFPNQTFQPHFTNQKFQISKEKLGDFGQIQSLLPSKHPTLQPPPEVHRRECESRLARTQG